MKTLLQIFKHFLTTVFAVFLLGFLLVVSQPDYKYEAPVSKPVAKAGVQISDYPTSDITYHWLSKEVGCRSNYSQDKKDDIFYDNYRHRWMTWSATVYKVDRYAMLLKIDGPLALQVRFDKINAGYDLTKGQEITVRFLMVRRGDCNTIFKGKSATIIKS